MQRKKSNKEFIKPIDKHSKEEINILFNHSIKVWESLKDKCIFPKPLRYGDDSIVYEFYDLPESLDHILKREDSELIKVALTKAGEVLAFIHKNTNLLHSDYVTHNLFFSNTFELYVIDAHPPEMLGFSENLLYGKPERDFFFFLMNMPSSYGLRNAVKNKEYIKINQEIFISGYKAIAPPPKLCIGTILGILRDVVKMRFNAGFGLLNGLAHALFSLYFLKRVYK